jgi:hypothetical protein
MQQNPALAHARAHAHKRPIGRESFSRSSRARVEDVLEDHSTQAGWLDGHTPQTHGQGFHIGADPRMVPYQYSNPPPYEVNPSGEMGHVMAPDAWSTEGGYQYLPHMSHLSMGKDSARTGGEGFAVPREYEFTYENRVSGGNVVGDSRR